ncbi:SGNH hydrolase-type esterase domain-containing protein [Clohesyomyces aquaticus]|uniref:SGNH hydrolase-type esterase domain-containing protein n=1 Tax=Clohesyomyces aquaticus TaxID=1231657 RepID=A0A1Y1Z5J7_9PLEO|nr:SGNH hydrolase-type esterase domain-containing protein [Clohesyomyces aquaticus]
MAADERIKGPKPIAFDFIACSGSRLQQIYTDGLDLPGQPKISQANQLKDDPEMVVMSIGGNDVGFCVSNNHVRKAINKNIDEPLTEAIETIFRKSPRTKLFITGYLAFWNHDTDYCDKVSWKLNCPNNFVLRVTNDRRKKMNEQTDLSNNKIKTIIHNWLTHADLLYVDVNAKFAGHRFCEEGVSEPSYRNPDIWFYPLEYTTGGQSVPYDGKDMPSGDCDALLDKNRVLDHNTSIDLNALPNNAGDGPIKTQKDIPDWLARVFHPTINGMTAYRDAIIEAYENYSPRQLPFQPGTCHFAVAQVEEPSLLQVIHCWKGVFLSASKDYEIQCDAIKGKVVVHVAPGDVLVFAFGDQKWNSDDTSAFQAGPFSPRVSEWDSRATNKLFLQVRLDLYRFSSVPVSPTPTQDESRFNPQPGAAGKPVSTSLARSCSMALRFEFPERAYQAG